MTGTLLAAFLLNERLDPISLIGVVVILTGVLIAYPHHNHVLYNYLHPRKYRIKRILHKIMHQIKS